ncbi:MAG: hypothetical protein ACQR33_00430 [Candidatus Saccharibacteria bacterium]
MLNQLLGQDPSFKNLDDGTRAQLVELMRARAEYQEAAAKLTNLRVTAISNPSLSNVTAVEDYSSTIVAPLRLHMSELSLPLFKEAFDLEGLKSQLPMLLPAILMGVLGHVNLPLVLTAIGVEPDTISHLVELIGDLFDKGMDSKD